MNDAERLIESTMPFVEELLRNYGEVYPVAYAITANDSIAQVGVLNGNDQPLSSDLLEDLKKGIRAKRIEYKTIAIFYDVRTVEPDSGNNTDAIAVYIESRVDNTAFTVYYPYSLTQNKHLTYSNPWKYKNEKEIFID